MSTPRVSALLFLIALLNEVVPSASMGLIHVEGEMPKAQISDHAGLFSGYLMCISRCMRRLNCKTFYFDQDLLECRLYDHQLEHYTERAHSRKVIGPESYLERFTDARCKQVGCDEDAVCVPPSKYRHQSLCVDEDGPKVDEETNTLGGWSDTDRVIDSEPNIIPFPLWVNTENFRAFAASVAHPEIVYVLNGGYHPTGIIEFFNTDTEQFVGKFVIHVPADQVYFAPEEWFDVTLNPDQDREGYWIYLLVTNVLIRVKEMKETPYGQHSDPEKEVFDTRTNQPMTNVITGNGIDGIFWLDDGMVYNVRVGQKLERISTERNFLNGVDAGSYSVKRKLFIIILNREEFCFAKLPFMACETIYFGDIYSFETERVVDVEWDPTGNYLYLLMKDRIVKYRIEDN